MLSLFCLLLAILASPFKSKMRLEAENTALRHQLIIVRRKVPGRIGLTKTDRLFFVQLYRWFPSILKSITIIRPETLCVGIAPAFEATGVGSHARGEGAHKSGATYAR